MTDTSPTFSVDTHLFRELGELLVGRDSTALVELVKNAYDADATLVTVDGRKLGTPNLGTIKVTDDGCGMTANAFERGFLRIASRHKETGDQRSAFYGRRYTGAKGVGRLAAQKLAKKLRITSEPDDESDGVIAEIDWQHIDRLETLEKIKGTNAIKVTTNPAGRRSEGPGTTLELTKLQKKWGAVERARFVSEVQSFTPPTELLEVPKTVVPAQQLLFGLPKLQDGSSDDPGFHVQLRGDFDSGEDYWLALAKASSWVLEIDAGMSDPKLNRFRITPTRKTKDSFKSNGQSEPKSETFSVKRTSSDPKFQARVLIRTGADRIKNVQKTWVNQSAGIRVFVEGFRVLPYGEKGNDWLSIDSDYVKRSGLRHLDEKLTDVNAHPKEGLSALSNAGYFGAVFIQIRNNPNLKMVVTREGFIPNESYINLVRIIRTGVDLSVRVRAKSSIRESNTSKSNESGRKDLKNAVLDAVEEANSLASSAKSKASEGNIKEAARLIEKAGRVFKQGSEVSTQLISEPTVLNILASVGTQMSEFVHEINSLLGLANAIEATLSQIIEDYEITVAARRRLRELLVNIGDLRRAVERQASYLTDVVSADARRRRSRQKLAERFDRVASNFAAQCEKLGISIQNKIPPTTKSPPMFPAEINVVFSNLISNAIKACRRGGKIRATASETRDKAVRVLIENTGKTVNLKTSEKWFQPFESTTTTVDASLGQGMGMGLTITKNLLDNYGATIRFVSPRQGFATAVEIIFR